MASPNSQRIIHSRSSAAEDMAVKIPAQSFPSTPVAAKASLPWYSRRTLDAFNDYERARRHLEQCRGELAVIRDIARGTFSPDERVSITDTGRAVLSGPVS